MEKDYSQITTEIEMKTTIRLILVLILASSMVSCESMRIRREMKAFLMDRDRHPVFVGNPMLGDDLMKLFDKAVSGLQKAEN